MAASSLPSKELETEMERCWDTSTPNQSYHISREKQLYHVI